MSLSWLFACMLMLPLLAHAQTPIIHQPLSEAREGQDLRITYALSGFTPESVEESAVFHRIDGELTYRRTEARITESGYEVVLPGSRIRGNFLQYYIEVVLPDGTVFRHPQGGGPDNPIELPIRVVQETPVAGQVNRIDFRILSPRPDEQMESSDALIAISFFYPDSIADAGGFRLILNDDDVTARASVSPWLITYIPENIKVGEYQAKLTYTDPVSGEETEITTWSFQIVPPGTVIPEYVERDAFFVGDAELTARNQSVAGNSIDFVRGMVNIRGRQGGFHYSAHGLLTSQESARLQPQNRYNLQLRYREMANLELGHVYPTLNPLLIAGRRILGVHAEVSLLSGGLQFQYLRGQSTRDIEPLYNPIERRVTTRQTSGGSFITDTTYVFSLQPDGSGAFAQTISGGRVSFGRSRIYEVGFNALRVRDDENSIPFFTEYDPIGMRPYLTPQIESELNASSDNLQIARGSAPPISNFVAAVDTRMAFDRNRIRISGDAAMSLLNNDISGGPLSTEFAQDLGFDLPSEIDDLFRRLSYIIVINENMNALPLVIRDDRARFAVPMGIFAWQSQLGLNYYNNSLNVQYRWIGPDFVSIANNGLRRDVAGITVTDRLRFLSNTLYVNLQYERLQDNLIGQLDATTISSTYGSTVSWFPLNRALPRVTVGVRYITRDNSENWTNPFVGGDRRSNAVRNVIVTIRDGVEVIEAAPTPRQQQTVQITTSLSRPFDFQSATHDILLNVSHIQTRDEQFRYGDFSNTAISAGVNSTFVELPLRTSVMLNYNQSEGQSGLTSIDIYGVNASGNYSLRNNTIILNAEAAILTTSIRSRSLTINSNDPDNFFDEFYEPSAPGTSQRDGSVSMILTTGATYRPLPSHQFRISGSYTNIVERDAAISLPNDHFMQFRYTYFF